MKSFNIKYPFVDDKEKNTFFKTNVVTKDGLSSNLLLLLLTRKGERLYQPNYGTNLLRFVFEPKDEITEKDIEVDIKDTVKEYMPELEITSIQFQGDFDDDGNAIGENELRVVIKFTYNEDTYSDTGELTISF